MKSKVLTIIFWVFLVFGALSIFVGISVPLFLSTMFDQALLNLWLKPDEYDQWGEVPGSNDIKLVRMFKIFNYTNPDGILNGQVANLIELPQVSYQEYTKYVNWDYEDDDYNDLGQKTAGKYLGFNSVTSLKSIPSNTTVINGTVGVTSFNYLTYINFYGLTHSAPPFYMVSGVYDVVVALEQDFYVTILSYVAWEKFIFNTTFIAKYLQSEGFNAIEIINDPIYGWGTWQTLKPWIQSLLDYNTSNTFNTYETLQLHFQESNILSLINSTSYLYGIIETIQSDMLNRYKTNSPTELGLLQWSTGIVTLDLPLNLGNLSVSNIKNQLPSIAMINTTFPTYPEVYFYQLSKSNMNFTSVSFENLAEKLLELYFDYPKTNYNSLANLNNLVVLFTNQTAAMSVFNFTSPMQIKVISNYLVSLIYTPVPKYNVTFDGYSLFLSKATRASLVKSIDNMIHDAYWSIPTLIIFKEFKTNGTTCQVLLSQANYTNTTICSSIYGFNPYAANTWYNLTIWIKAAYKGLTSIEYSQLSSLIPPKYLNTILFNTLYASVINAMEITAKFYNCTKVLCTYEDTFNIQWSSGNISYYLPIEAQGIVMPSKTLQQWLPSRYLVPIEWSFYSNLSAVSLASEFLNYSSFLNTGVIRHYYNMYFTQNASVVQSIFGLPNEDYVEAVYKYFVKIVPGLSLFRTLTYNQWINGYSDSFVSFAKGLGIYGGGLPTLNPLGAISIGTNETGKPKHVVETGRLDTAKTKIYKKYFNSTTLKKYTNAYDEYSSTMTTPVYNTIWPNEINITGSDGGQYGTKLNTNNPLIIFLSPLLRMVNLTHDHNLDYHGLSVSRFTPSSKLVKTSDQVPINSEYSQNPNGYDGFMNVSAQYGAPAFVSFMHCYLCDENAQKMVNYYKYKGGNTGNTQIFPSENDSPYSDVEPLTGSSVRIFLNYEFRIGVYNDYFFKGFYEPVIGKGVYFPVYTFMRKFALTDKQVNKFFGDMQFVQKLRMYVFYSGIIAGCVLIVLALIIGVALYRRNKYDTWKSRRNTVIKKYVRMTTVKSEPPPEDSI
ncbi:hypothetical protein SteCoe_27947 [Stentor coeruleus]|uniref:CD36 family protein n=1 Tax=Stentor coeruleus TaxID=5963 RepID=A0A1R2B9C5_9CILI|nr:hypothetical protein SteCoe_27947 [Stentor coeruleus]